jgi:hypothetical protein
MLTFRPHLSLLLYPALLLTGCKSSSRAALTTLTAPQGGTIVYGQVSGVTTQAAAMGKILRNVHENCGERPEVGRVFRFKGTEAVGVFFTTVNHPGGNKRVAGLVIAAQTGARSVEAALVSDDASRFGTTVNPMLSQLYRAWHPGGGTAVTDRVEGAGPGAGASPAAFVPAMRRINLPDGSASVSLPSGWQIIRPSGGGYLNIAGPNNEILQYFGSILAIDPNNPQVRQLRQMNQRYGQRYADNQLYYPYGGDLARAFVTIYQQHQRQQRLPVTQFDITHAEPAASSSGYRTVHMVGRARFSPEAAPSEFEALHYEMPPLSGGAYYSVFFVSFVPQQLAEQERATLHAILQSYSVNMQVVNAQAARNAAPAIAAIKQIGRDAAARSAASNAANDAQHARYWAQQGANAAQHSGWNAQQDANARTGQGFHNYLLDQTVVQDNNMHPNGTVGHGTTWNSTADALIRSDPKRFEAVNTPNYWKGVDY